MRGFDPPWLEVIVATGLWPTSEKHVQDMLDRLEKYDQGFGSTGTLATMSYFSGFGTMCKNMFRL